MGNIPIKRYSIGTSPMRLLGYIPWDTIYMTMTLYNTCNPFICTILLGISEIYLKDLVKNIIEAKVA